MEKLVRGLDNTVSLPGISSVWVPLIRNRLNMLATGINSPVGIKVNGNNIDQIEAVAQQTERVHQMPGITSALAERLKGGRYIDVDIDRVNAAHYGVTVQALQSLVAAVVGGENIGQTIEGRERYPRELRDSVQKLRDLPVITTAGAQVTLGDLASIRVNDGPPMLKSENARLSNWIYAAGI